MQEALGLFFFLRLTDSRFFFFFFFFFGVHVFFSGKGFDLILLVFFFLEGTCFNVIFRSGRAVCCFFSFWKGPVKWGDDGGG